MTTTNEQALVPNSSSNLNPSVSLLNNICNLVYVRLDSTNYVLWRFQISPLLKSHKLYKYVDGSIEVPEAILRTEGQPPKVNPAYEQWYERDQALITLINATLTQTALSYVIGCKTAKEVWDKLEKHFSSSTRTNIVGLKTELQSVVKKSGESVDQYVQRVKDIVNRLAAVSVIIDSEDLIIYTVNGLPSAYNIFKTSLRTRSDKLTFDELHVLMKTEESAIEKQSKIEENNSAAHLAMAATFDSQGRGN